MATNIFIWNIIENRKPFKISLVGINDEKGTRFFDLTKRTFHASVSFRIQDGITKRFPKVMCQPDDEMLAGKA